jgi:hypothetical protein
MRRFEASNVANEAFSIVHNCGPVRKLQNAGSASNARASCNTPTRMLELHAMNTHRLNGAELLE